MTAAVPDPRFPDQLAEVWPLADQFSKALREHADDCICDRWVTHHSQVLAVIAGRIIAAEVEARVQAAANQRAAEVLEAAAQWLNADPDEGGAPYITNDHTVLFPDKLEIAQVVSWACASLRDRAAALASPAPTPHAEAGPTT